MLSTEIYTATSLLPNQATKNSCEGVTNSKVKCKVIFSGQGLLFNSNGMTSINGLLLHSRAEWMPFAVEFCTMIHLKKKTALQMILL